MTKFQNTGNTGTIQKCFCLKMDPHFDKKTADLNRKCTHTFENVIRVVGMRACVVALSGHFIFRQVDNLLSLRTTSRQLVNTCFRAHTHPIFRATKNNVKNIYWFEFKTILKIKDFNNWIEILIQLPYILEYKSTSI